METRVAVMSIIVENKDTVEKLNGILHEYGEYIIGRMGIPYKKNKHYKHSPRRSAGHDSGALRQDRKP